MIVGIEGASRGLFETKGRMFGRETNIWELEKPSKRAQPASRRGEQYFAICFQR